MSGKREKEKRKGRLNFTNCTPYEAMGWMYGFACKALEDGKDIREMAVPDIMALGEEMLLSKKKPQK